MHYRQINIKDADQYTALPEGDYASAYKMMINDQIDPKDVDAVMRTMSPEVLCKVGADSNGPSELIARYHLKDDPSGRLMQSRAIFIRNELPHYVIAVVTDVTEEMMVSERRNTLEALLDNIDVGIFCFEFHGDEFKIVGANAAIMEMMGHKKEVALGASTNGVFKFTHPDDYPVIQNVIETMKHPNQRIIYQYRTLNKYTKKYIWLEGRGHSVAQPDGSVLAYICYIDITESKEQELELKQNHKAVELAQNEGKLSIWTYNIDKKVLIQQTSENVEGHLGYAIHIDNVPNCFIENKSIHPDDIDKYLAAYNALADGAEKSDVSYRIVDLNNNQYRWVHMFYHRIYDDFNSDRMAAGFSMDIDKEQEAIERYQLEQSIGEQMYQDAVMYMEYNLMTHHYEGKNNLTETYLSQDWEVPTQES